MRYVIAVLYMLAASSAWAGQTCTTSCQQSPSSGGTYCNTSCY